MSKSKVVVVTGVSSGIGRAAAIQFAQQGCRVFGTVRNTAKAHAIPNVTLIEMDIVRAALGAWKMRHTPKGEASLLAKLRRFMPAGPVGKGLRKSFGLA